MRLSVVLVVMTAAAPGCATEMAGDEGPPPGRVLFGLPVAEPELIDQYIGVDHDPEVFGDGAAAANCTAHDGRFFPWCYDEHRGSDYILDGGFDTMDAGSATVIAAQAGRVMMTHDGEYDRCRLVDLEVSCDGNPIVSNRVVIDHGDGVVTQYLHLMTDSIVVEEGDDVTCGQPLAKIGSSGNSSMPHLHFEVEVDGAILDPYAGEFSQEQTWWVDQGDPEGLPGPGCTAP